MINESINDLRRSMEGLPASFFSEPYIAVSVSVSGTGIDTETGTCDEILLEVCLHKLLGYIEAVNIGTCN